MSSPVPSRHEHFLLHAPGAAPIALQVQRAAQAEAADVLYVHGATFGADLSVFFPFDGVSWADAITQAGRHAWGFDFVGFGASGRYPPDATQPAGAIDAALQDLERVVTAIRARNGGRPLVLLAHSRGGAVAARYAGEHQDHVQALVLFAPIVARPAPAAPVQAPALPPHYPLSAWAQYRRFVEDVPRGQPQVLSEAHMQAWAERFLASDPAAATRSPPAVLTPAGPLADIAALWSGQALYDPAKVRAPTLLVRGEWDTLCTDGDAGRLLSALAAPIRQDAKIPRATHLMHLEQQCSQLHAAVNRFLEEVSA
jgi:alpha-beta hydrolase superfamily lysophospholipase